jgi:hypothetical protein
MLGCAALLGLVDVQSVIANVLDDGRKSLFALATARREPKANGI